VAVEVDTAAAMETDAPPSATAAAEPMDAATVSVPVPTDECDTQPFETQNPRWSLEQATLLATEAAAINAQLEGLAEVLAAVVEAEAWAKLALGVGCLSAAATAELTAAAAAAAAVAGAEVLQRSKSCES
jgi:hypothetical protein